MKIIALTQARIGSSRLPIKVLKTINEESLLKIHLKRILKSELISELIVATTKEEGVSKILSIANECNLSCFQGDLDNVLDRFYQAVKNKNADYIVRLTSDCPLIDAKLIDQVIKYTIDKDLDYCSNVLDEMFPDGQDVEVFKFSALEKAWNEVILDSDKEHVTPYIHRNSTYRNKKMFKSDMFPFDTNYNHVRLTVDEPDDFIVIEKIIKELGTNKSWLDYTKYYLESGISQINSNIIRNEGYQKSLKNN
tara:strand:- start:1 stop:753 length:753 start_codon:yes stop_codon:yes gene_type:complete